MKTAISIGIIFLFILSVYGQSKNIEPNKTQFFCQKERCLTCVGKHCATTCRGLECARCPKGDCCDGYNCNVCRRTVCCQNPECNVCVNNCVKECITEPTCHYECFKKCLPETAEKQTQNEVTIINRKKYLPFNVTTVINITNTVTNNNSIYNPISVNANSSQFDSAYSQGHTFPGYGNKIVETQIITEKQNCCEVIHPEMCFIVSGIEWCYTRKHQECSKLCISKYVHIIPAKGHEVRIPIKSYPFYYQGEYALEDCDICYNCPEGTAAECTKSNMCPTNCKNSMRAEYNKRYEKKESNIILMEN